MGPMMKKQMRKRFEMVGAEVEAYLGATATSPLDGDGIAVQLPVAADDGHPFDDSL